MAEEITISQALKRVGNPEQRRKIRFAPADIWKEYT